MGLEEGYGRQVVGLRVYSRRDWPCLAVTSVKFSELEPESHEDWRKARTEML